MKKFLSMALALAMAAALAVPAMAAPETVVDNVEGPKDAGTVLYTSGAQNVTATVTQGSDGVQKITNVYYVTVEWKTNTAGKYRLAGSATTNYKWNPGTKTYDTNGSDEGASATASAPSITVEVTNGSDKDITAELAYVASTSGTGSGFASSATTSNTVATIVTNGINGGAAYTADFNKITLGGDIDFAPSTVMTNETIGTVTLTIKAA